MKLYPDHMKPMRHIAIVVALLVAGAMLVCALPVLPGMRGIAGYLPLHMLLETLAIVVSMLIFAVGWHAHNRNLHGNIVLLACAFLGVGLLDFAHMLSYAGMPDFVTPSNPEKAINFWLAARSLAAVGLFAVAVMPWRPFVSGATRYMLFALVLVATALAYWLILFHQDEMPHTFIPGQGLTQFKIASEYAIIALNLAAAFVLRVRMRKPLPFNAAALFGAVCVMALSELFFTLYVSVTDVFNLLGHVYKVIAYLLLYRAFFVATVEIPYRQLELSKSKLRGTLDAIPDLVWLKDADGVYLECNAMVERFFGVREADIIGKTDYDFLNKGLADFFREHDRKAMVAGKPSVNEEWLTFADDNHSALLETIKTPMYDDAGKFIGVLGIARDITGRKQAEDTLRKLSLAVEQSPSSIVITDLDANIEYVNQAFVRETGYSTGEAIGQTPRLLNSGKNPKEIYREMWSCLTRGDTWRGELINRRKDGSEYIEFAQISPVQQADGKATHYLAIKENINERKNNEAKIERLSRTYRLLSRVNEAIVRVRDRNELFTAICAAAIESGLFRFAWIGMLDGTWVIPVAHAGVEEGYLSEKFNILLDDERTGNGPTGRATREGAHIICQDIENDPCMTPWRDEAIRRGFRSSAAFPVREKSGIVGAISVYAAELHFFTPDIIRLMMELAADVSFSLDVFAEKERRKQMAEVIIQLNTELEYRVQERTRQLEAANKELEAFSYSVSHDLRAPLRSIDGFSRVLSKKYHDQLDSIGQDWLERICHASQHMGLLIDDILQLSLVARSPLRRGLADLSKIAENVADGLRRTNLERQVSFVVQQGLSVQADPGLLRIVMDNLLGNAYKFTGKKADAEIEFGERYIDGERTFFVRDNGDGFNMDYVHKLFGAFQRLHTTNEFEGTGIGLATVQRIINRHNGRVWAEAIEGQGAAFYFTLPQRERGGGGGLLNMMRRNE